MQKARREDFRAEEELRSQKVKYEEASEDVYRRMQDIKETESESAVDLEAFLDAELNYYDRCRDALLQLRNEWPNGWVVPSQNTRGWVKLIHYSNLLTGPAPNSLLYLATVDQAVHDRTLPILTRNDTNQ